MGQLDIFYYRISYIDFAAYFDSRKEENRNWEVFYLQMFLYFIGSAVYIGYVPVGFLFCLLIMLSHPDIKNKRFKIIAIALGFIATLISLAVNKLKL